MICYFFAFCVFIFFSCVYIVCLNRTAVEPVGPGSNQHCELSNPPNTDEAPDAPVDLLVSV